MSPNVYKAITQDKLYSTIFIVSVLDHYLNHAPIKQTIDSNESWSIKAAIVMFLAIDCLRQITDTHSIIETLTSYKYNLCLISTWH